MGLRGPPRIPTKLKLLRGNPAHQMLNLHEPEPMQASEVPEPPGFLSDYGKEEWRRIIVELYRLRLMTIVDLNPLAAYCQAYSRWRVAEEKIAAMAKTDPETGALLLGKPSGIQVANPLVAISDTAARAMIRYAGEFGLTPAARSRLTDHLNKPQSAKSKFDGLIASS